MARRASRRAAYSSGGEVAGVGQVTGAVRAARAIRDCFFVGVIWHDGQVGQVALLLLAGHVTQDGMGDLLLVELGLAGLVEVAGGLAELLVGEIVEGLVQGDVAGAESVAVKGTGDAGAQGVVLVDAGLEVQPCGLLAGGDDFGVPLAGG